jgi:hypothetical protein
VRGISYVRYGSCVGSDKAQQRTWWTLAYIGRCKRETAAATRGWACMSSAVIGYEETGQSGGVLANREQTNNAAPTTMAVDFVGNENATEAP